MKSSIFLCENLLVKSISTRNHMFGGDIWKIPKCIFENFEIALVKRGQFQIFWKFTPKTS